MIIISNPRKSDGSFPTLRMSIPISKNKMRETKSGSEIVPVNANAETNGNVKTYNSRHNSFLLDLPNQPRIFDASLIFCNISIMYNKRINDENGVVENTHT